MAAQRIRWGVQLGRWAATAVVLAVTAAAVALIYQYYVAAPWTRDGRVRVLVASVAPQVSGQIVELRVIDNQAVKKGDVLYKIDPFDFDTKLDAAKTQLKVKAADLEVKKAAAKRRESLDTLAASVEEKQKYAGSSAMAEAEYADAATQFSQAQINRNRTEVKSPVNGFITNFTLRLGDYAGTSAPNVAIVDSDSFWIDGYFEETKLARICVGDRVEAQLMGFAQPVTGRVASLGRGISVSDAASGTQGLPNVSAVYTWVRLAQRVPIRVDIVDVPKGVPLVGGLTATVRIRSKGDDDGLGARAAAAADDVLTFFHLKPPRLRACAQPDNATSSPVSKLPYDKAKQPLSPEQVAPGLAPGMDKSPTSKP